MQSIQINNLTPDEFQRMIQDAANNAVQQAVEAVMKVKQDPNEEITITTIAGMWGCSKQTVARRIKDHKVPAVKLGRDVAIKRKFLEQIKLPVPKEA